MSKILDFSGVPADLQKHVVKKPEVLKQVFKSDRSFFSYVEFVPDVIDRIVLNKIKVKSMAQPGGKGSFTPKNDVIKPEPRYGYVKQCKVDLEFDEEDITALWKSYLGELERRNPQDIHDMPYQQVFIDLILEQLREDDHLEALYKGVRDDAGMDAVDMYDGFIKIINDDIAAGIIKPEQIQTVSAFTVANTVEQLEVYKRLIPERYRTKDVVIIVSPELMDFYESDYRNTFGSLPYNKEFKKAKLDGTNWTFEVEEALAGTQETYATTRFNFKYMAAGKGDMQKLKFQEFERNMKILGDWRAGVNYAWPEWIWKTKVV